MAGIISLAVFVFLQGKAVTVTARPSSITDFIGETKDMIEQTLMETSVSTSQTGGGGVLGSSTPDSSTIFILQLLIASHKQFGEGGSGGQSPQF